MSIRLLERRFTVKVPVEQNRRLFPRATFREASLAEGDELEVVTLVGGG